MTNRAWSTVLRRATEPMVTSPREPVGDVPGLFAQVRILSAELSVHRRSTTGLRSPRRTGRWATQDEPHRSLILRGTVQNLIVIRRRGRERGPGAWVERVTSVPVRPICEPYLSRADDRNRGSPSTPQRNRWRRKTQLLVVLRSEDLLGTSRSSLDQRLSFHPKRTSDG